MNVKLKIFMLSAVGLILNTRIVEAENCSLTLNCSKLGYSLTETNCENDIIRCPFDASKVSCKKKAMTKTCDTEGDILYANRTCAVSSSKVDPLLLPVGVVFNVDKRLAIALSDVKQDGSVGSEKMNWSSSYCVTPNLESCGSRSLTTCGTYGQMNSQAILASTCDGNTYAANAANNYAPSTCTSAFCQKGKWFLPSMGELTDIYNAKRKINIALGYLVNQGATELQEAQYWSSNRYGSEESWVFIMDTGGKIDLSKNRHTAYVRPIVQY